MKKQVDYLLLDATVLTMNENMDIFEPGAVAVSRNDLVAVGGEVDIKAHYDSDCIIDCKGKVLMPGLVNAHTHVPMTLLRGLADDLRLDVWLLGYMMPVEREFVSPDFVRLGTLLACAELIRSGVTCFADMYYFEHHVAQAAADAGMRALCGQTVLKYPSPDALYYEESLEAARKFIMDWKDHDLIVPAISPHAPYTCTQEILRASAALAVEFDVPLHTHLSETALEVENSRSEYGMPVIPYVKKQNIFEAKVLAAHCVHVDDGEIKTLANHKAGVAHNPSSNLKLASGFAPVTKMLDAGLNVGIGTDGPASNNDLDMFEEVRLAAFIAKGYTGDPTALPAQKALSMGTRLGAKAMHMGHLVGSLEPGKKADLILVNVNNTHNLPRFRRDKNSIYAQLAYTGHATDVTDVMINGKWVMQDRILKTLNEKELLEQAADYARRTDLFLIQREQSVLSKLIAIGGATEEESFEVQIKIKIDDPRKMEDSIKTSKIEILHHRHFHEFDTYFAFDDPKQGYLRYREDEYLTEKNEVDNVRYRLTLIGPEREDTFPSDVLLSRSRFIAPAPHSRRFYHEYFKPTSEFTIEKIRRRWRVLFQGTEFYINIDQMVEPDLGSFAEIKSRTWSKIDAENKARTSLDLLQFLGASPEEALQEDYIELIQQEQSKRL